MGHVAAIIAEFKMQQRKKPSMHEVLLSPSTPRLSSAPSSGPSERCPSSSPSPRFLSGRLLRRSLLRRSFCCFRKRISASRNSSAAMSLCSQCFFTFHFPPSPGTLDSLRILDRLSQAFLIQQALQRGDSGPSSLLSSRRHRDRLLWPPVDLSCITHPLRFFFSRASAFAFSRTCEALESCVNVRLWSFRRGLQRPGPLYQADLHIPSYR